MSQEESNTGGESSSTQEQQQQQLQEDDDWSSVTDPSERRKIQNRIAQRKFREKVRQQREEAERAVANQSRAAGSYNPAEPEQVDTTEESGLPWGGISIKHVLETGKAKEQSSRESSINAAVSRAGGSSRLGLHLIDQYARGSPAWAAWRNRLVPLLRFQEPPVPSRLRQAPPPPQAFVWGGSALP